jgi:hypothetical protein
MLLDKGLYSGRQMSNSTRFSPHDHRGGSAVTSAYDAFDQGGLAAPELRELAQRGELAAYMASASPARRAELTGAAYEIAWPVVFTRITRPMERRRGHWACSPSVWMLADDCLDRYHEDVEAVVTDLLRNARTPIRNVERWMSGRLVAATVDGHRRWRGRRGALQRPRVPAWLTAELGGDPWLTDLAVHILTWVGLAVTSGTQLWPVDSWAQRREVVTGDVVNSDATTVSAEIERVLAAMRKRPQWYADFVERPLGCKNAPVLAVPGDGVGDARPLLAFTPEERYEARLTALATAAIDAITHQLRAGADPTATVVQVLGSVFSEGTGHEEIDQVPDLIPDTEEWVSTLLTDDDAVARIVDEVLCIVGTVS